MAQPTRLWMGGTGLEPVSVAAQVTNLCHPPAPGQQPNCYPTSLNTKSKHSEKVESGFGGSIFLRMATTRVVNVMRGSLLKNPRQNIPQILLVMNDKVCAGGAEAPPIFDFRFSIFDPPRRTGLTTAAAEEEEEWALGLVERGPSVMREAWSLQPARRGG